eukprot:6490662-Amphidinium_carterae.1
MPLLASIFLAHVDIMSHWRRECGKGAMLSSIGAWKTGATQLSIDGFRRKTCKHILRGVWVQDKASL